MKSTAEAATRLKDRYIFAPGIIGEGALTLWLLAFGIDAPRWLEQAGAAAAPLPTAASQIRS